jgi:ankyrin repeat protein
VPRKHARLAKAAQAKNRRKSNSDLGERTSNSGLLAILIASPIILAMLWFLVWDYWFNVRPNNQFEDAARSGDVQTISSLITRGINVNADVGGRNSGSHHTALMVAAENLQLEVVSVLLKNGADARIEDSSGMTAMSDAITWNSWSNPHFTYGDEMRMAEIVEALIKHDAPFNMPDRYGKTPLILAARNGFPDVVKVLLDHHADVNAKDNNGHTALSLARNAAVIAWLHDAGAR